MRPYLRSHDQRRRSSLQYGVVTPDQQHQHHPLGLTPPHGNGTHVSPGRQAPRLGERAMSSCLDHDGRGAVVTSRKLSLPGDRLRHVAGEWRGALRRQRCHDEGANSAPASEQGAYGQGAYGQGAYGQGEELADSQDLKARLLVMVLLIGVVVVMVAALSYWIRRRT